MKFLTIASLKDAASTLPPSVMRQIFEASIENINQHKKVGKILEAYSVPGWGRFVVIGEAKSAEELLQNQNENPIIGFMNLESYPLADWDESAKIMLESLKVAEQRATSPPR